MADKAIHEMISAFAAGCMDKANFVQFKDYINEGGELPDRELGELQNIISMIPVCAFSNPAIRTHSPTPCAPDCGSSNTPPAWVRSSPPSNGGPAFLGRSTCLRRCCG